MTSQQRSCPVCGSAETKVASAPRQLQAADRTSLEFVDQFTRCERCGEEFYTREQSLASSRAAAAVLRTHEGLLAPDRIQSIRHSYGLTQADFERALRLGPKTVVRWEVGTVRQSATANSLLIAIEGNPAAFAKVAAANGFAISSQSVQPQSISVKLSEEEMRSLRELFGGPPKPVVTVFTNAGGGLLSPRRAQDKFKVVRSIQTKPVHKKMVAA